MWWSSYVIALSQLNASKTPYSLVELAVICHSKPRPRGCISCKTGIVSLLGYVHDVMCMCACMCMESLIFLHELRHYEHFTFGVYCIVGMYTVQWFWRPLVTVFLVSRKAHLEWPAPLSIASTTGWNLCLLQSVPPFCLMGDVPLRATVVTLVLQLVPAWVILLLLQVCLLFFPTRKWKWSEILPPRRENLFSITVVANYSLDSLFVLFCQVQLWMGQKTWIYLLLISLNHHLFLIKAAGSPALSMRCSSMNVSSVLIWSELVKSSRTLATL